MCAKTGVSLIDRETLYVVAEASRSLNLGDNSIYDNDGDGLWMGCSRGPVAGTLCEKTITLYPTPQDTYPFFIVDDLRQHPRYCHIPCVADAPFFRFYAGTPLMTSSGVNIGSLYVIDPRPNLVLTESHKETIGVTATAVMEYLETSRQSLESGRLMKVLSGFKSFVQDQRQASSMSESASMGVDLSDSDESPAQSTPLVSPRETDVNPFPKDMGPTVSAASPVQAKSLFAGDQGSPSPIKRDNVTPKPVTPSTPSTASSVGKRHEAFQRAADIMRRSLSLGEEGGVAIFALEDRFNVDIDEDENLLEDINVVGQSAAAAAATAWAIATKNNQSWVGGGAPDLIPPKQMTRRFLQRTIRRFCQGALWYFHRDGTAFSSDEETNQPNSGRVASQPLDLLHPNTQSSLSGKDTDLLRTYFPKATRIIFAPLWDPLDSRWFGGCFCWSSEETRIFSRNVELGGVLGFCSSLMTEDSRIRSQEADNKKAAFIGSISHELRSPLHGILAAVEFLFEQTMSNSAMLLLDTIRACSQTLLDVFEQILDFSKINSFRRRSRRGGPLPLGADLSPVTTQRGLQSLYILKEVDIVTIVEDAIESICSGANHLNFIQSGDTSAHEQASNGFAGGSTRVDISLDINKRDWIFSLNPGALRRIVMNVFGNALKYTSEGYICVKMEIQKKNKTASRDGFDTVLLTISDTGRGISNDYLRHHLFTPFMQENPLSPGTGLGLSLVNSIVRSLKGTIKIKSLVETGTMVKIAIPLMRPEGPERILNIAARDGPPGSPEDVVNSVKQALKGKTVSFVGPEDISTRSPPPSALTITKYLTHWFGIPLQKWSSGLSADLVIADETQLHRLHGLTEQTLLLILHRERHPSRRKSTGLNHLRAHIEWLNFPCGPYRLARTIQACLQAQFQFVSPEEHSRPHPPVLGGNGGGITNGVYASQSDEMSLPLHPTAPPLPASATPSPIIPVLTPNSEPDNSSPGKADTEPQQNRHTNLEPGTLVSEGTEACRVLLVEDNPINMVLLQRIIERQKAIIVHKAVNGKEAVDAVRAQAEGYHYIFMDLSMPVMNGFEATKAIRAIEAERHVASPAKIIALTGLGSNKDITKAYEAGVDVFITKPVSLKKVMQLIDLSKPGR
ncbi:two-component sensor protein histidine protein kinase [Aspergillus granulosus]|uniref:histidine kinase n=1 Tax=Aspergillus granulosus TaxID=176169 RepID=A0ABR4GVR3_9EURO